MYMLSYVLYIILDILNTLIFVRVILSFIPMRSNKLTEFIVLITEPVLGPVRMLINKYMRQGAGLFDWSPFIAVALISLLQSLLML